MWKVRELADKVTNVVMNYTEIEAKVREATNDESWGPTGPIMQELAQNSFTYEHFPELMAMLWRRMLSENKSNYLRIYKSLILLNYLLRNGSERVVTSAREHLYDLRTLESFSYIDELGKDQGINIRHRAKQTVEFLQDENRVREERKKAKKNKDKYIGVSKGMIATGGSSRYMDDYDDDYSTTSGDLYKDSKDDAIKSESPQLSPRKTAISPVSTTAAKSTESTPTRTKPKIYVSKKIDLGAAADYAKQQSQQNKPSSDTITTQPNMLFDLLQADEQTNQQTSSNQPSSTQVTDLFDNLTLQSSSGDNDFADFSKFNEDQTKKESITQLNNDDDDFADFASFNSLPAQTSNVQSNAIVSNKPVSSSAQDDLLGLDVAITNPSNLLIGNSSASNQASLAGLSSSFTSISNNNSLFNSSSVPTLPPFQAESFLTPLTPSKPSTLNFKSSDQFKIEPKQSPTAQNILTNKNTWGGLTENLKIDLDNLLQNKKEKPKPSMNQMAANRTTSQPAFVQQGKSPKDASNSLI